MSEKKRNVAVGITVLVALAGLGYMILLFGEVPAFARGGYQVRIGFPSAGNVIDGADVRLNGKRIGTVGAVELREDVRKGVTFDCRIEHEVRIPDDVAVRIATRGLAGGAYVSLQTVPRPPGAPPAGWLATDGSAKLTGDTPTEGLIGPEVKAALDKIATGFEAFTRLADNLNKVVEPLLPTTREGQAGGGVHGAVARLNRVLAGLEAVVGDEANRKNIKDTLADLRLFAADARKGLQGVNEAVGAVKDAAVTTRQQVDVLAKKLIDDADRLGKLFATLERAAVKIDSGDGTAGKMLNDPRLYNELLESARRLSSTLAELEKTIRQWREKGVSWKLR